ncbi:MAG: SpoIIIAC/SpoIIIAD family protein [Lachnospiraceae bacterium]
MSVFQVILFSITGVIVASYIKTYRPELYVITIIAISLVVFFYMVNMLLEIKENIEKITSVFSGNIMYFQILFKIIGITYLSEFTSGICKDAGYQSIATQVELVGKITILLSGIPILIAIIETIQTYAV